MMAADAGRGYARQPAPISLAADSCSSKHSPSAGELRTTRPAASLYGRRFKGVVNLAWGALVRHDRRIDRSREGPPWTRRRTRGVATAKLVEGDPAEHVQPGLMLAGPADSLQQLPLQ